MSVPLLNSPASTMGELTASVDEMLVVMRLARPQP
jgi:hypothetical protein